MAGQSRGLPEEDWGALWASMLHVVIAPAMRGL